MSAETVTITNLQNKFVGMGIAVIVTGMIAGIILQFTRRFRNMPSYFRSTYSFFKGKPAKLPLIFTIFYYILLATPIILHIIWVILLGVNVGANPALPVLFYGIFIGILFVPSYSRFFYFKVLALFITFVVAELLTMSLTFQTNDPNSFFCLTAVMLTLNSIFVAISLWILDGSYWSIPNNVPSKLKEQIMKQIKIWKKEQEPPEIITGGIYGAIMDMRVVLRIVTIAVSYVIGLAVLGTYSIVGYIYTDYGYQALVNSIAIITTDVISLMLIFITKKTGFNPIVNTIVAISMRVLIIAFSGQFWFGGYCLIYLLLMTSIMVLIINKHYPSYEKFSVTKVAKTNIFKMPEFSALLLLVMFSALVFYMGSDNDRTLPVAQMTLGNIVYPFWAVGVAVILISAALFFYLISLRIIQRARDRVRSVNFFYMGCESCGEYYFFLIVSYLFLVILGFYLWSRVGSDLIWASCVFLPLFYQAFLLFYTNWTENDYLILGDLKQYNKKIKKRKQRRQKVDSMKQSLVQKMKEEGGEDQQLMNQAKDMAVAQKAQVHRNFMVQDYDGKSEYSDWREQMNIIQAFKDDKLLPSDRKILISIPIMCLTLVAYSVIFFFVENRDMSGFTISVQILVIFLGFIPVKRYFSTFQKPQFLHILSFVLAVCLNYGFGIASYLLEWNKSPAYTVLWAIVNVFLILAYATFSLLRDKGFIVPTYIFGIASVIVSYGIGVLLIVLFDQLIVGIALLAVAFYYTYCVFVYFIYIKMNKSLPFIIYIITFIVIIGTCFAVMIYAFVSDDFDDFYGFSVTYLVINLLILMYGAFSLISDYVTRYERPNFYSAYGSPIYKYKMEIKSVVENLRPMRIWLVGWFMFFVYCLLMMIFIVDSDIGVSASQIFLVAFYLSFIYFTTFNLYRAGKIKDEITPQIMQKSWQEVLSIKQKSLGNLLDHDQLAEQLLKYKEMQASGQDQAPSAIKIHSKQETKKKTGEGSQNNNSEHKLQSQELTKDISLIIYEIQNKLDKVRQNDKILLIDFYTTIIFKCESVRKRNMLQFNNFIRDSGDVLGDGGIAIVLDETLYDLQSIYNQAYQEFSSLSPMQKIYFNKQMKLYGTRKSEEDKKKQQLNNKQTQNQLKRQKQLENKLLDQKHEDDSDLPIEKMRDSPAKFKKMKQTLTANYVDNQFRANNDTIPSDVRSEAKGWKRPSQDAVIVKDAESGMNVRQGYIGDCYLISAIGLLGKDRIKNIIGDASLSPLGAYMVKFSKMNKDLFVIIDSQLPVSDPNADNKWLFGRCEDEKQLFCGIIEKAYAKLYGGYDNIVGGKVALALADITGGFPEQIQLKQYQEQNMEEIFTKMLMFKQAGYLMGAGTPAHEQGDSVEIDGIFQGHAYLILDVRDLDGNKLIKLRNPHGNNSVQSTLDWSDESPKWTKRLKGLIGQQMGADGAFWMGLQDFVYCYRAIYICRIFDDSFVKIGPIKGAWKGKKAAGLRNPNGRAQLQDNPQYGIRVNKNCTLFLELTQYELEGSRAKNKIFFMVQKNNGKRIEAPSTNKMAGMSGPAINSRTISKQIHLQADSYPYTFSLMTSIFETGVEGTFTISMYCNDKNIQLIEDEDFDN